MKKLYILALGALLSACGAFNVVPGYSPYVSLSPPTIQRYQKPGSVGSTDTDQRWEDFKSCGVKSFNEGSLDFNTQYAGMSGEDVGKRSKSIRDCIKKDKGYVFINTKQCVDGKNNKLTGLCN